MGTYKQTTTCESDKMIDGFVKLNGKEREPIRMNGPKEVSNAVKVGAITA